MGFTFQLSTRGNVLLKPGKSHPFYDASRKDLLASYGIIKESVSGNLGHDSGKCFCPRFVSNTCPAGVLSATASLGAIQSATTLRLANGEAGGLRHRRGLGDGDGDRGQGTTAFKGLSHHPGLHHQRGVRVWRQTLFSPQHAKRETPCSGMWWAKVQWV